MIAVRRFCGVGWMAVAALGALTGCGAGKATITYGGGHPAFGQSPWTRQPVQSDPNEFHFVIMSDRCGGHREGVFEEAVEKVNLMQPDFVICVGDLIEGYTENRSEIQKELAEFEGLVAKLDAPFCRVGGNHDLTNDVLRAEWRKRFGTPYHYFVYRGALFVCLCTEDGAPDTFSDEQIAWLKRTLARHADARWTFLFMHKPAWREEFRDKLGWDRVAAALGDRRYTVFAGHWHRYAQQVLGGRDHIMLATTGGMTLSTTELRGVEYGEFDQIVWVTMTNDGPQIANLELSGIHPKDVVTADRVELISALTSGQWASANAIRVENGSFTGGDAVLALRNECDVPMQIRGRCRLHAQAQVDRDDIALTLDPGQMQVVSLPVSAPQATDVDGMQALEVELTATVQPSGGRPLSHTCVRHVFFDYSHACGQTQRPIVVDGKLDEWSGEWIECRKPGQVARNEDGWRGVGDGWFRFATAYDNARLYIAVDAVDSRYVGDPKQEPWLQDGFYVHLDGRADPARSQGRGGYDSRFKDFLFFVFCPGEKPGEVIAMESEMYPGGVQVACQRTERGMAGEISIPISYLNDQQDGDWSAFRLNVGVTDYDPGEKDCILWWLPRWSSDDNFVGSGTFNRK